MCPYEVYKFIENLPKQSCDNTTKDEQEGSQLFKECKSRKEFKCKTNI